MSFLKQAIKKLHESNERELSSFLVRRTIEEEEEDKRIEEIKRFFKDNPVPDDVKVHELADKLGIEHAELEEQIYKMLADALKHADVRSEQNESHTAGFTNNIEEDTIKNQYFRKVLYTTNKTQLVLMSLKPGEEIGVEIHDGDQFFRFEKGEGKIIMNGKETAVTNGSAAVVREGTEHNVINTSSSEDLKLYAIYSPPQHRAGTVDKNKPAASDEEDKEDESRENEEVSFNVGI